MSGAGMARRLSAAFALLLGVFLVPLPQAFAQAPKVVASLLPVHSLAAQIMEGAGEPVLLVEGSASPHNYQLRPSDAALLQGADLIVWVGPVMEGFLVRPLDALSQPGKQLELLSLDGLLLTEADHQHAHEDAHEHEHAQEHEHEQEHEHAGADDPEHLEVDGHIWLAPENAAVILKGIAARLIELDPAREGLYRDNLAASLARLSALDHELAARLEGLNQPFVVFHDAYGGFVQHYGLAQVGVVTLSPDRAPGAGHLSELRALIEAREVACLFAEPQFSPAILESLRQDLEVRVGALDPLGAGLQPGPEAHAALLEALAASLLDCLSS
jgi:zinc transport system substrate-binding protein